MNEDRRRYYGLCIGDLVSFGINDKYRKEGEVVNLGGLNNNAVIVRFNDGREGEVTAEWCDIIKKVEERV